MKLRERITIIGFCGFLLSMTLAFLLMPKSDFSENEKRYLAEVPKITWEKVSSGDWGNEIETYLADHIPGRDFFVGVNAYFNLLTGRQAGEDIWLKEGKLVESPVTWDDSAITRNVGAVNKFADTIGRQVDLMIIPSAGWAMGLEDYKDEAMIRNIYDTASGSVRTVDVADVFAGQPELYYDTDHHWTSEGAYLGYRAYREALEKDYRAESDFTKGIWAKFQGSTFPQRPLADTCGGAGAVAGQRFAERYQRRIGGNSRRCVLLGTAGGSGQIHRFPGRQSLHRPGPEPSGQRQAAGGPGLLLQQLRLFPGRIL